MILRYGLLDDNPFTLEEVGQKYSVSRERIRQIEAKALRKLNTKRLLGYLKKTCNPLRIQNESENLDVVQELQHRNE